MKGRQRRFVDGAPYHACSKGIYGFCIFYSYKDCLVFICRLSVLLRKYRLKVSAFCLMINHYHILFIDGKKDVVSMLICRLESEFAQEYNHYHQRHGSLFKPRFGGAPKVVVKTAVSSLIYIFNNPVIGNICPKAMDYRWNLLAYRYSDHPYSLPAVRSKCSRRLTRALKLVDYYNDHGYPINYDLIDQLFDGLNPAETEQLIDYIVSRYRIIDYDQLEKRFDNYENALAAIESTSGSEYDIEDDWDDYGKYAEMVKVLKKLGYPANVNFETIDSEELNSVYKTLATATGATRKQLRKFLHLNRRVT
ncbi:MAG: hypothetical protein MJY60_03140 [Bacteroidales bacterium]|nr:hypothetical protein [Bacteroidales bacterium]